VIPALVSTQAQSFHASGRHISEGGNVIKLDKYFMVLAGVSLLAGCSSAPSKPAGFTQQPNTCAVLVGGTGMVFPDEALNQRWIKVNSVLSNHLADDLQQRGYRIDRMIVDIRSSEGIRTALGNEMAKSRCNKFIQVSHALESAPGGDGKATYFSFKVTVMGIHNEVANAGGGTRVTIVGGFDRTYRYPLTTEVMQQLSMATVAQQIADDIDASKQLNKAQPE
jgi:hypothetical protein